MTKRLQSSRLLVLISVLGVLGVMAVASRGERGRMRASPGALVRAPQSSNAQRSADSPSKFGLDGARPGDPITFAAVAETDLDPDDLRSWKSIRDRVDFLAENHLPPPIGGDPAGSPLDSSDPQSPRRDATWINVVQPNWCFGPPGYLDFNVSSSMHVDSAGHRGLERGREPPFSNFRIDGKDMMVLRDSSGVHMLACDDVGAIGFEMHPGFSGQASRNILMRHSGGYRDSNGVNLPFAEFQELRAAVEMTRSRQDGFARMPDAGWVCGRSCDDSGDEYAIVWIQALQWIVAGTDRASAAADVWYVRCGAKSWVTRDPAACAALIRLVGAGTGR